MTLKIGKGVVDVGDRACIVVVHDGDEAELIVQGEPGEVGQLLDAATRALAGDDDEALH